MSGGAGAADATNAAAKKAAAIALNRESFKSSSVPRVRALWRLERTRASPSRSREERLHLVLIDAFHELINESGERDRRLGVLGELKSHVHVLLGPFAGAAAPALERPIGAGGVLQRGDQLRDVGAHFLG